ncbi:MAG: hypothetical protein AAF495_04475 [Pseudomonadota bacterium]
MLSSLFTRFKINDLPSPEAAEVTAFWTWFSTHHEEIEQSLGDPQALVRLIAPRLHRVHGELTFEVGRDAGGTYCFVVSADGILKTMPAVETLVAGAPGLAGWRVVAFRPPKERIETIQFQGCSFAPDDFWYAPLMNEDGQRLDLVIAVGEDKAPPDDEQIIGAAFLLLDALIGEYNVMTRVGAIDFAKVPAAELNQAQGFKPLTQLNEEFESRFGG